MRIIIRNKKGLRHLKSKFGEFVLLLDFFQKNLRLVNSTYTRKSIRVCASLLEST
jgi:hypothetical protein